MDTTLQITGMTCDACVRHVNLALAAVPGVEAVNVDLASGSARVVGNAEPDALIAAVADSGYAARLPQPGSVVPAPGGCGCGTPGGGCGSRG